MHWIFWLKRFSFWYFLKNNCVPFQGSSSCSLFSLLSCLLYTSHTLYSRGGAPSASYTNSSVTVMEYLENVRVRNVLYLFIQHLQNNEWFFHEWDPLMDSDYLVEWRGGTRILINFLTSLSPCHSFLLEFAALCKLLLCKNAGHTLYVVKRGPPTWLLKINSVIEMGAMDKMGRLLVLPLYFYNNICHSLFLQLIMLCSSYMCYSGVLLSWWPCTLCCILVMSMSTNQDLYKFRQRTKMSD